MNFKFEKDTLYEALWNHHGSIYDDKISTLEDMKIGVDATMLFAMATDSANP